MILSEIQHGLPGTILPVRKLIRGDMESFILDLFLSRNFHTHVLLLDSSEDVYTLLKHGYETFGLLGDANGSLNLIDCLESQAGAYYIVKNRENVCDSANNPEYTGLSKGIIITDHPSPEVVYNKLSNDLTVSSMFCSKYEFKLNYDDETHIKYIANEIETSIDLMNADNPNNRTNIMNAVNASHDIETIAVAFQKKRSGDWFQALSCMDTERLYRMPSGVQKLNGPVYFCTEDRVAAAYAFSLGINTLYCQKSTNIHMLYNQSTQIDINPFKMSSFNSTEISTYASVVVDAIHTYDKTIEELHAALSNTPNTNHAILQYIGYIYEVVLLTNRFGGNVQEHRPLLEKFVANPSDEYTRTEQDIIHRVHQSTVVDLNRFKSHDIHAIPRFPSLPTITPISTSGVVGPSELYINGLLSDFKRNRQIPSFAKTAIQNGVAAILSNSVPSDELTEHYGHLLTSHVGGFVKSETHSNEYNTSHLMRLGKTYLDSLYLHIDSIKRYNTLEVGKYSLIASTYSATYTKLQHIVETTGLLKSEFHEYQQYVADKKRKEQEEEDAKNSQSSPEFDAYVAMLVEKAKLKKATQNKSS